MATAVEQDLQADEIKTNAVISTAVTIHNGNVGNIFVGGDALTVAQPRATVYLSPDYEQTVTGVTSNEAILFDTLLENTDTSAITYSTATGHFTIQKAGVYNVISMMPYVKNNEFTQNIVQERGGTIIGATSFYGQADGLVGQSLVQQTAFTLVCEAGDVLYTGVSAPSGTTILIEGDRKFPTEAFIVGSMTVKRLGNA